ncbi:MAG: TIGR01777 family oxidoreductase [Planctomycetota bacterium]
MGAARVVIAGGTGFLGLNLVAHLEALGYAVTVISRSAPRGAIRARHVSWDGRSLGEWAEELNGALALVNLAGRTVDCVKTPDHCDEILRSRVEATRVLGAALRQLNSPPPVWVQMSTAHRYGDPPEVVCDEDSAFGYGLAPFVGSAWEEAYLQSVLPGMRQVILRTSFVIGRDGGALPRLATLVRWGLGGRVASGRQGMSWLHVRDMNRIFARAILDESMTGAYIATAPQPVSQNDFMRALRGVLRVPIGLPTPAWLARLGAPLVMRTDPELALYGRYCVSRRLRDEGFEFEFPELRGALADLFRPSALPTTPRNDSAGGARGGQGAGAR